MKSALAAGAVSALLRVLDWTWRSERVHRDRLDRVRATREPYVYALWHGRMLVPIWLHRGEGIATMASKSKDGEVIARWLSGHGFVAVRGSTNKGGARGIVELGRWLARGHAAALTVDGPKGPPRVAQEGIATLARRANAWIVPVSGAASRPRYLESWDRYLVPRPFSRIVLVYGEPFRVGHETNEDVCRRVGEGIDAATAEADAIAGVVAPPPW